MRSKAALLFAIALSVVACGPSQPTGIVRDPAPAVGHLALPNAAGAETSFVGPEGGFLLVYFGYTNCPDVCPTTMADVRSALAQIGDRAERFTMAMITIDPDRDTAAEVDHYVNVFIPNGIALRTEDDEALRTVADAFGADYLVETSDTGEIIVSHSAFLYAVDEEGKIRLQWPFGSLPDDIAHDFKLLLDSA